MDGYSSHVGLQWTAWWMKEQKTMEFFYLKVFDMKETIRTNVTTELKSKQSPSPQRFWVLHCSEERSWLCESAGERRARPVWAPDLLTGPELEQKVKTLLWTKTPWAQDSVKSGGTSNKRRKLSSSCSSGRFCPPLAGGGVTPCPPLTGLLSSGPSLESPHSPDPGQQSTHTFRHALPPDLTLNFNWHFLCILL